MAKTKDYIERVDDAILAQAHQLSRLRDQSIHASLADLYASFSTNERDDPSEEVWSTRKDRCNMLLANPDARSLRVRAAKAASEG